MSSLHVLDLSPLRRRRDRGGRDVLDLRAGGEGHAGQGAGQGEAALGVVGLDVVGAGAGPLVGGAVDGLAGGVEQVELLAVGLEGVALLEGQVVRHVALAGGAGAVVGGDGELDLAGLR